MCLAQGHNAVMPHGPFVLCQDSQLCAVIVCICINSIFNNLTQIVFLISLQACFVGYELGMKGLDKIMPEKD